MLAVTFHLTPAGHCIWVRRHCVFTSRVAEKTKLCSLVLIKRLVWTGHPSLNHLFSSARTLPTTTRNICYSRSTAFWGKAIFLVARPVYTSYPMCLIIQHRNCALFVLCLQVAALSPCLCGSPPQIGEIIRDRASHGVDIGPILQRLICLRTPPFKLNGTQTFSLVESMFE